MNSVSHPQYSKSSRLHLLIFLFCLLAEKNSDPELIGEMISFGMKVARFDMNYTTASDQAILIKKFRSGVLEYSKKIRKVCTVAIAIELKGTVISIGAFHNVNFEIFSLTKFNNHLKYTNIKFSGIIKFFIRYLELILVKCFLTLVNDGKVIETGKSAGNLGKLQLFLF